MYLITDEDHLYFRRAKSDTVAVLSRLRKDGSQSTPEDLTSVSTGFGGGLTIANGFFYWTGESGVAGCPFPNCGTPTTHVAGMGDGSPFSNPARTTLFWLRNDGMGSTIMTRSSTPAALATTTGQTWTTADNTFMYFLSGPENARKVYRVPSVGGAVVELGAAQNDYFRLAVNSRHVFTLGNAASGSSYVPGVLKYSLSQTARSPEVLGHDKNSSGGSGGLAADEVAVYWIDLKDSTVRILKCGVAGCGASPTVLANTPVDFPDGGLTIDGDAVYWATDKGVYKVRKH